MVIRNSPISGAAAAAAGSQRTQREEGGGEEAGGACERAYQEGTRLAAMKRR